MILLRNYTNLRSADTDHQLLSMEGIQTTMVASDGRTIEKWTDYETNFGDGLSGSLYAEDDVFNQASQILQKVERERNRSRIFTKYYFPIGIQIIMWFGNFAINKDTKELLKSSNIPIKYTGAVVYSLWLIFETKDFVIKYRKRNLSYDGINNTKQEIRDYVTKLIMACALFAIAYFLY